MKTKMFTPERLSLILLAIAVVAFAIVVFITNHREPAQAAAPPAPIADTAAVATKGAPIVEPKSKRQNKSTKKTKTKENPRQRDHLREIVPDE